MILSSLSEKRIDAGQDHPFGLFLAALPFGGSPSEVDALRSLPRSGAGVSFGAIVNASHETPREERERSAVSFAAGHFLFFVVFFALSSLGVLGVLGGSIGKVM